MNPVARTLALSQIFKWYREDFEGRRGTLAFIGAYLQDLSVRAVVQKPVRVRYLRHDWSRNAFPP